MFQPCPMTDHDSKLLIPCWVQIVFLVGSLHELMVTNVNLDIGVSQVASVNVEEGRVSVRQSPSLYHVDLECTMEQGQLVF